VQLAVLRAELLQLLALGLEAQVADKQRLALTYVLCKKRKKKKIKLRKR